MRPDMKSIEMKFQPTIKEVLFILLFIAGEMKWNFASGEGSGQDGGGGGSGPEKTDHPVKANYFCFDELNACAVVLFHMISFRVVFTWYFIPRNEISFLSKWRQWNITNNKFHFGLYQVWKIDQTPK